MHEGLAGDDALLCLGGRGAAPPQYCGGPTGYRLMLQRQKEGEAMGDPGRVEFVIRALAAAEPDAPTSTWDLLRETLTDGLKSIDRRLEQYGPLRRSEFSLRDANARLAKLLERGRWRS